MLNTTNNLLRASSNSEKILFDVPLYDSQRRLSLLFRNFRQELKYRFHIQPQQLRTLSDLWWYPAMKNKEHKIEIAAKPEDVWKIVMDFGKYPEWNPMVVKLSGDAVVGQRLHANVKVGTRDPIVVKPLVLTVEPNKEFRWVGTWVADWLVRGEHYFRIEETPTGCTFYHGEDFSGLCVGVVFMMMGDDLDKAYAAYDEAIKERAESLTTQ